jgi:uncharacterized protein
MLQKKASAGSLTQQRPVRPSSKTFVCKAQKESTSPVIKFAQKAASFGAASLLALGSLSAPSIAGEFDVLAENTPKSHFFVDDANVMSKSTRGEVDQKLKLLEIETGYRITAVTVRKLEFEPDTFVFADKIMENWYPNKADADKKGIILVVTAGKEGAIAGGQGFMSAVGDDLLDSVTVDNIPIYTEQEKYNQCVTSVVDRLAAKLKGDPVPEAPRREDVIRQRTYKTKEEVEKSKTVTTTVVVTLLIIAVVVPMLQYYGYTARD